MPGREKMISLGDRKLDDEQDNTWKKKLGMVVGRRQSLCVWKKMSKMP
jgi:hypothetical protein